MGPPVTVVVVSWNTRALLERCLDALAADAEAGLADVWVVDNASADGSAEAAVQRRFVRVLAQRENLGYGPAVDLVAGETRSPYLVCANADTAVTPGALARLRDVAEARPSLGAVAPRLVLPDGSTQYSVHAFPTLTTMALHNSGLPRLRPGLGRRLVLPGYWDPELAREVGWAVGAFLLVRRSAFDRVGGFGPRRRLYGEDLDLGWRLARAGYGTWYEPGTTVLHDESAATRLAWGEARHQRRMLATYGWLLERRGPASALATAAVNVGGAAVRGRVGEARLHAGGLRAAVAERRGR